MRAQLFLYGTIFMLAVGALVFWRPVMTLCLALLGAAVSVWRMKRPVKHPVRTPAPAPRRSVAKPVPAPSNRAANENDDILTRLAAAGWTAAPAATGAPWLVAGHGDIRVALRTCTPGTQVSVDDIADAKAAKAREGAQFAAVVSLERPADDVAEAAKAARVQIINLPRLEPYLALATAFKTPVQSKA